jgi:hypothetical protein
VLLIAMVGASSVSAQWPQYRDPTIPRTADGKPDLSAPVPKTADGKPDLSGIWMNVPPPAPASGAVRAAPGALSPPFMNIENFVVPGSAIAMLPEAERVYRERRRVESAGRPSERCLPHGIPDAMLIPGQPFKIVQTPRLTLILYEEFLNFRQVFTDGRPHPTDPNPAWLGYSTGKWDGDTFVVETTGFNDQTWLDDNGHPHTSALRTTERFRRLDVGRMELRITVDDAKAYAKPWTVQLNLRLAPDTDLIEDVCDNEKDAARTIKQP